MPVDKVFVWHSLHGHTRLRDADGTTAPVRHRRTGTTAVSWP
jgi:hypothetical protein